MTDLLDASGPDQIRAFSHPLRHRIWRELGGDGATISQLGNRLMTNKGNIAHHLGVLVKAGLVTKGPTRTVRGGTEQYYLRTSRRIRFAPDVPDEATAAMLTSIGEEIVRARRPLLNHRTIRLTRRQAEALSAHLDELLNRLEPAGPREQEYGVLVSLYRR
ncbi:ArsR/SmtB family transcription factor [Nocardioides speluncae]|uniref:ArsR/SmtB family transcription factor n=1 Tax=Nocardioides speluncae TaxID=2670337 RepID=UPI000D68FDC5|nr:helix-turn-helix domain-containing protein [Nocardioides speluncae]